MVFLHSTPHPQTHTTDIHQLELITDVLGKPTEAEINLFENEKARKFMRSLPAKKRTPLQQLFPNANPQVRVLFNTLGENFD